MVRISPRTKKTSFKVNLPDAQSVVLVGDFNEWNTTAHPMKKNKAGTWKIDLTLNAGEYQFRYLVDGCNWKNDESASSVPNHFGSQNSVVTVSYSTSKRASSKSKKKA